MTSQLSDETLTPLSIRDVLRIRDYRWLWFSQIVSNTGDALTRLALVLLVNAQTNGSASAIAGLLIVSMLPGVTVGLVAGAYVDRWPKKRVMISAEIIQMFLILGFVAYTFANNPPLWIIYSIGFLSACAGAFFMPARMAIIPRIVPQEGLMAANSLGQISRVLFSVIGTSLAGLLVGILGQYALVFAIDSLTFLLSPLLIWQVVVPNDTASDKRVHSSVWADMREGMGVIGRDRILVGVLFGFSLTMLGAGAMNVLLPPMIVNDFQVAETWFGAIEFVQSAAMILAGALVTALAKRFSNTSIIALCLFGIGGVGFGLAFANNIWHLFPVLFAAGLLMTPLNSAVATIIQTRVAESAMGRVGAALDASISTAALISMFATGFLADRIGIDGVFYMSGVVICCAAIVAALIFRGQENAPVGNVAA